MKIRWDFISVVVLALVLAASLTTVYHILEANNASSDSLASRQSDNAYFALTSPQGVGNWLAKEIEENQDGKEKPCTGEEGATVLPQDAFALLIIKPPTNAPYTPPASLPSIYNRSGWGRLLDFTDFQLLGQGREWAVVESLFSFEKGDTLVRVGLVRPAGCPVWQVAIAYNY